MGKPLTIADGNAFFALPKIGSTVEYLDGSGNRGWVSRKDFDTITIQTKLGQKTKRSGYEHQLKITERGFERAHALGRIVGHESPHGIYLAPKFVNQQIQKFGAEKFLRAIGQNVRPWQSLYVTVTVIRYQGYPYQTDEDLKRATKPSPSAIKSDFLKHITYTVHTQPGNPQTRIFEAGFDVNKPNLAQPSSKHPLAFSTPYISPEFNKYCNLDKVLLAASETGLSKAVSTRVGNQAPPTSLRASSKPTSTTMAKSTSPQSSPKTSAGTSHVSPPSRFTSNSQRGLSGSLRARAKDMAARMSKFTSNAGRSIIKRLPVIIKGGLKIHNGLNLLGIILESIKASMSLLAYGTAMPKLEKELKGVISEFDIANRTVTAIYQDNILKENHQTINDELYNLGDKETLDEIVGVLMEEKGLLVAMRAHLVGSLPDMTQLHDGLYKKSVEALVPVVLWSPETASKGLGIIMHDALLGYSKWVSGVIPQIQASIDTLDGLLHDYEGLIDTYNGSSWTLSILRNHDSKGEALPASIVKPTKGIWGPNVLE